MIIGHLWQNKKVAIYHCDKCRMCRMGSKDTIFHCDPCNVCLPIHEKGNHICVKNTEDHNCPVCMENIKFTTKPF